MKERLNALKESISLADAEMLSNELGSFDENYSLTADEQQRILSSVMRKAGFEMNKKITVNRPLKRCKHFIALIAVIVIMITGAFGAGAYYKGYRLDNGQIIRKLGGENAEEFLESNGLNEVKEKENGHFDISITSIISDGNYCRAFWCIEALDEAAVKQLKCVLPPTVKAYYADTGEEINMSGSHTPHDTSINDEAHFYFSLIIPLRDIDVSRDIEFRIITGAFYVNNDENLADGLSFTTNVSRNVETKIIADEKETELLLSPLGISHFFGNDKEYYLPNEIEAVKFIKRNQHNEIYEVPAENWGCLSSISNINYYGEFPVEWSIDFNKLVDISDIEGIKINDDVYMVVDKNEEQKSK